MMNRRDGDAACAASLSLPLSPAVGNLFAVVLIVAVPIVLVAVAIALRI